MRREDVADSDLGGDRQARWREERRHASQRPRPRPSGVNASSGDVASPSAPIAGPASEPKASTLITWPTVAPRDSRGAFAVSQAMPHVHAMPDAAPWMARAPPSTSALGANAKASVEAVNRTPATTIMRRPP